VTFFESLVKPSWIPPDWAFPTAWFTLWFLQAIAVAVLFSSDRGGRSLALGLLAAQFVVAVAWEAFVFGPAVIAAWRVERLAGLLIAPTIVWVSVATTLGFSLLRLNPGA